MTAPRAVLRRLSPDRFPAHLILFGALALILLSVAPPLNYSSDGASMLAVAESLVTRGAITVPCARGSLAHGGACYSTFYLLQSVALVPFVAIGRLLGEIVGISPTYAGRAFSMALPAFCVAGAATFASLLAVELGAGRRRAIGVALAFAFCTEALAYSRTLYAEPLGALCLAAGCWGMLAPAGSSRSRRAVGLVAGALVVAVKPQLLLAVPAAGAALAIFDRRPLRLLLALALTGAGSLLVLGYNALRFGSAFNFGGATRKLYVGGVAGGPSPVVKILDGAASLLVSPNHGLLVFAPVALVGTAGLVRLARTNRVAATLLGGVLGVFVFAVIQPNGNAWGTRYLVPLLPLACVGLAALGPRMTRLALLAAVVGLVVQLPVTVSYFQWQYRQSHTGAPSSWDLGRLQALRAWPAAVDEIRAAARTNVRKLVHSAGHGAPNNRVLRTVALWWWVLPAAHIPWLIGALFALCMAAAGLALIRRLVCADVSQAT